MSLYRVKISYETVVEASDEMAAIREAVRHASDAHHDGRCHAQPITSTDDLPGMWTGDEYPWGRHGNQTIGEILDD